jgi:hypothetical protein
MKFVNLKLNEPTKTNDARVQMRTSMETFFKNHTIQLFKLYYLLCSVSLADVIYLQNFAE